MIICVSSRLALNFLSWNKLCTLPEPSIVLFCAYFWRVNDVNYNRVHESTRECLSLTLTNTVRKCL